MVFISHYVVSALFGLRVVAISGSLPQTMSGGRHGRRQTVKQTETLINDPPPLQSVLRRCQKPWIPFPVRL